MSLLNTGRSTLLREAARGWEGIGVTVCIAAICDGGTIFGASDRMLTAGDIQFEPPSPKIWSLTSSIAVMTSGDAAFQKEVLNEVSVEVSERVREDQTIWLTVKDAAELFVHHRNEAKLRRAEATLLAPLGLNRYSFVASQDTLSEKLVDTLARDMINFAVPQTSTIIAGIDEHGAHIYVVSDGEMTCCDTAGFACIGIGARHAESQFMLAQHAPSRTLPDTLLLAYSAKRRAEIAPGVGTETDLFVIGPALGTLSIVHESVRDRLEEAYQRIVESENTAQAVARTEIAQYVEALRNPTDAEQEADGDYLAADGAEAPEPVE